MRRKNIKISKQADVTASKSDYDVAGGAIGIFDSDSGHPSCVCSF